METDGSNLYAAIIDDTQWVFEIRPTRTTRPSESFITTTDPDDPTIYRTEITNEDGLVLIDPDSHEQVATLPDDVVDWGNSTIKPQDLKEHGYLPLHPLS